jgi:hypothetical protein
MNQELPQQRPASQRDRIPRESFFALFAGPIAWYLQLCAGYALSGRSCAAWPVMVAAMVVAASIALISLLVSWRILARTRAEAGGREPHPVQTSERTRFLAQWGVVLGGGFAFATLMTGVAFIVLPRCAG